MQLWRNEISLLYITSTGYFNDPELPTIIEQAMLSREDQFGEMKVLRNINREHSWSTYISLVYERLI